jgi:hypothetical protein
LSRRVFNRKACLALWSKVVRQRDNNTCQVCKKSGEDCKLDAHHIIDKKYIPFELDNGITLCSGCHKFSFNSAHCNGIWWADWLKENKPTIYKKIQNKKRKNKTRTLYKYESIFETLEKEIK